MEKVESTLEVINDNTLEVTPTPAPQDNSEYTITIKGVKDMDGNVMPPKQYKIITAMSPMYCTLKSLKSLTYQFGIPDDVLLMYIRDASQEVDFIVQDETTTTTDANDEYARAEYVRTKALINCLMQSAMDRTVNGGGSYKLDVAELEDSSNSVAFAKLLDRLRKNLHDWQDALRGYYNEGRAKPKATRIGTKSNTNSQIAHTTVDKILNDFSRTMPEGND